MAGDKPIRWGNVKMSREEVAQVLYQAGFRGQDLVNFVGIAFRESGGHPNLYVERPSTGDWSYGLVGLNIGKNRSLWPAYQKMGFTDPEQLATAQGGARAAYQLWKQMGYYPWGGYKGKSGTYGTDLKKAAAAVQNAANQGLLGKDYQGSGAKPYGSASTVAAADYDPSDPLNWKGIAAGIAAGRIRPDGTVVSAADSYPVPEAKPPPMNAPEERTAFETYLKSIGPDAAAQVINDLKQGRSLQEISQYM